MWLGWLLLLVYVLLSVVVVVLAWTLVIDALDCLRYGLNMSRLPLSFVLGLMGLRNLGGGGIDLRLMSL